ncbi:uncharacterized protein EI90DRAFT_3071242, partial [Cantharellus anzutake]|uniref:uncharacterized protein n=1 Tax=Cantharellus anzutake TaxID=1750568 RepID=UPI001903D86C
MRKKNAVLEGEVVLLKRLIAEKEGSFKKELGELGSAKALLCEELEKQKTLLSEMGKVMRELKSRQEGCEEEMKKLRLEHQRDMRVLKEEVVQRDARVLVEKFPTASKSLIQAFVMTANLGKRRRNGLGEDEGCRGDYLYLLLLFG